jgi:hypothetical protein
MDGSANGLVVTVVFTALACYVRSYVEPLHDGDYKLRRALLNVLLLLFIDHCINTLSLWLN